MLIGDNASACRAAVAEAEALGFEGVFMTTFCRGEAREVGKVVAGLALGIAHEQSGWRRPVCLVMGGETTVTVRGDGSGGRNQELALAAARRGRSPRGRDHRCQSGTMGTEHEQSGWRRPVGLVMGGETTVTVRGDGSGGRNQELALAAALALDAGDAPAEVEIIVASLATDGTDGPTDAAGGVATPDSMARGRALGLDAHAALAANDSLPYLDALGDLILTGPTGTNVNDVIFALVR